MKEGINRLQRYENKEEYFHDTLDFKSAVVKVFVDFHLLK